MSCNGESRAPRVRRGVSATFDSLSTPDMADKRAAF
jgi:hypothetical protein